MAKDEEKPNFLDLWKDEFDAAWDKKVQELEQAVFEDLLYGDMKLLKDVKWLN